MRYMAYPKIRKKMSYITNYNRTAKPQNRWCRNINTFFFRHRAGEGLELAVCGERLGLAVRVEGLELAMWKGIG